MEKTLLNTWHVISGKWYHIAQVLVDDEIYFYTDGKLEKIGEANKLKGVIK